MISVLAPNFTLTEFASKSDVALTPTMREHARWHAEILQRARDAVNAHFMPPAPGAAWTIHVTSFVRSTSVNSDHASGAAVDWNVRDQSGNRNTDLTKWARDWLALNAGDQFAELIWEPAFSEQLYAHVHHARRGFSRDASANERPQILDEISQGSYVQAAIATIPKPARPIVLMALVGIGVYALAKGVA